MANKAIALSRIVHNGVVTEAGEELQGVDNDALESLAAAGAVEIVVPKVATKPAGKKQAPSKKD
jgi:hypothetical protein